MNKPAKGRIRNAFERAAKSYDQAADIQRRVCQTLARGLACHDAESLLDAGCGTGYAHALLRQHAPRGEILALDLSTAMLAQVAAPCRKIAGDIEQLPLADASIDLYWSSLALQWCDLAPSLQEARRTLRAGGQLAIATLGPETFHELRSAFAGVDAYRHTLGFCPPDELRILAKDLGLQAVDLIESTETAFYPDFRQLLLAVKAIGANQVGRGQRTGLMSRSAFLKAEAAYETLRREAGLPLSYHVLYLHARV